MADQAFAGWVLNVSGSAIYQKGTNVTLGATYNLLPSDGRLDVETDGSATITSIVLPAASSTTENRIVQIVDVGGHANLDHIDITVSGGGLISGAATYTIGTNYGSVTLLGAPVGTASAWIVINQVT